MQCPACGHERPTSLLRCSNCGRTFPRELIEQYDHIKFLQAELADWRKLGIVSESAYQKLERINLDRLRELEPSLGLRIAPPAAVPKPAAPPRLVEPAPMLPSEAYPSRGAEREFVSTTRVRPRAAKPPLAAPQPPLRIPRPQISWEAVWRALLSPRSLEALLYVGAFLILVAAGTFVLFNWGRFSPPLQFLFLTIFTSSFFIIGWQLRTRWRLIQSSTTFIGIGALIIPIDFYAWVRFRDLPSETYPAIWLAASLFCAGAYAATTRWIRHRFFFVITLVALHNVLLAGLRLLRVPIDWWAAPTILLGVAWVFLEQSFDRTHSGFGRAAFFTAATATIIGLLAPAALHRAVWTQVVSAAGFADRGLLTLAAAWWAGGAFLIVAGRDHRPITTGYATAGATAVAVILTLLPLMPRPWISLALVGLALLYSVVDARLPTPLARAATQTAPVLSVAALAWALQTPQTVSATYLASAALYAWWTSRLQRPILVLAAQAAGLVGLLALLHVLRLALTYWPVGVVTAAILGLAIAAVTRRVRVGRHLHVGSYAQVLLALSMLPSVAVRVTQVAVLGAGLGVAVYSAVLSHTRTDPAFNSLVDDWVPGTTPIFQWCAAVLAAAELVVSWLWWRPMPYGLPAAAMVLASVFVLTGRVLGRVWFAYARPWVLSGFGLSFAAILLAIALQLRGELIATLALAAATYALWAWLLDEPRFLHLASSFFLVPFVLLLPQMRAWGLIPSREAYAWAFGGLGVIYLIIGAALDLRRPGFSGALHLVSNVLVPFGLLWSLQEEDVARWTLAMAIPFYIVSAWLAHRGRHPTFLAAIQRVRGTTVTGLRTFFVYAAAWLFPFWFHLTLHHVPFIGETHARLGVAAATLAWGYLGIGQWAGARDAANVLPFRIAAQALTVIGALLAADQRAMVMMALAIGVALQVAFYRLSHQIIWIYTAALGGAGLAGLVLRYLAVPAALAGWGMLVLAAGYLALAEVPWRRPGTPDIPLPSTALYAVAFVVAAVGLLLSSFDAPWDSVVAYALGALLYGWTGRRLREPLMGYGVAGLLAAAYVVSLVGIAHTRGLTASPYGLWLVPGIAAFFTVARLLEGHAARGGTAFLAASWAGPFYLAAHVGIAAMMVHSIGHPQIFPLALGLGAVAYGVSAGTFRSPYWLYPALLAAHGAIFFGLVQSNVKPALIPAAFVPVTIVLVLVARRLDPRVRLRSLGALSWAQPLHVIALADLLFWELVGVIDASTHVGITLAFTLLTAVLASWWQEDRVASLSLVLAVVAVGESLRWLHASYPTVLLSASILALVLGGAAVGLRYAGRGVLWQQGARVLALVLSGGTVATAVIGAAANVHPDAGAGLVYALAVVGLLYLMYAITERREWLGYLAVGMLEAAWAIFLLRGLEVKEIQWYAIPAALYLLGIGMVERQLQRRQFAQIVDLAGLTLLFGSSLWQSFQPDGFSYAVLLAIEALLVTWFGAVQRVRRYFFAGLGVLIVNVIIQAINPLRALDKTVLFLSLGILLVVTAVLAERKREDIIRTTREWRTRLETWE